MNVDVLIVGGSAAGLVAASTTKMNHPEKSVLLIRKEEKVMVPCGIPYVFGTIGSTDKNVIPDVGLLNAGVEIMINTVAKVHCEEKYCTLATGEEIHYEKLILGTGSTPSVPKWLKGASLKNVFTIRKSKEYLDDLQKELADKENIVVVGGGFIGVETADELNKLGKNVRLVERLPHILSLAFDPELAEEAESLLAERGVKIVAGQGIKEITGVGQVEGVLLENGELISADAVVLSMGYKPNVELARQCNAELNELGFIAVDEYMRTSLKDVFAVGDCAEKKCYFTRKNVGTMLASTACAEARVAGMNLYKLSTLKTFGGTIAIYSTALGDASFSTAGLTEWQAEAEGFEIVTGTFQGINHHPGSLPGTTKQIVKLIASKESGTLIGGEIIGGLSSGELINVIGMAIENKMSLRAILTSQIGTHPLLTASPAAYPLIKAAEIAYINSKK